MPDIIEIPHTWTPVLTASDLIENLSELEPSLTVNKYLAPLVSHCYKQGTKDIYSLPWWLDVMALHYRADHLATVSKNPEADLGTWQGMLDICARLKTEFAHDPNYYPIQNSDWRGNLSVRSILPCIWGRGSDLFSHDGSRCNFTEPAFIDGLEDYIKLADRGYLPVLRERGSVGTMVSGRASLFITRRQGLSMFEATKTPFQINTLNVPATGKESVSFLSGINLVITKSSSKKEEALKFLNWLMTREAQLKYASLMEAFPAVEDTFDEFIFSSPKRMVIYAKIIATARTISTNMVAASATKMINEVLEKVSMEIINGRYDREFLERELVPISKEADYLLNLYGG